MQNVTEARYGSDGGLELVTSQMHTAQITNAWHTLEAYEQFQRETPCWAKDTQREMRVALGHYF